MWTVLRGRPGRGADANGATVYAEGSRDSSTEVAAVPQPSPDRQGAERGPRNTERDRGPREARRDHVLAGGRGVKRGRTRGAVVSAALDQRAATSAEPGGVPHRATAQGHHAATAPRGVLPQPNGYGYTKFTGLYNKRADRQKVTMRQVHKAGEKCFVDCSGNKSKIVDRATGERVEAELFVAVMGALNCTYAESTATHDQPSGSRATSGSSSFSAAHARACSGSAQERRRDREPIRAGDPAHVRGVV